MKNKTLLLALTLVAAVTMAASGMALTANASTPQDASTDPVDATGSTSVVYEQVKNDGTVFYSTDGGKTWISQADYEKLYPANEIEWWTYEGYAEFVAEQKISLQKAADEGLTGYTGSRGDFVWTQELVDETIQQYEQDLENIKNGAKISKSISGIDGAVAYESYSIEPQEPAEHSVEITLSDGTEKEFSGKDKTTVYAQVKDFCTVQVAGGKMTQKEANAILNGIK